MIYLLDINALLALGFSRHVHHERVGAWLRSLPERASSPVCLASCSITEIGFVRIAAGGAVLASSVSKAKEALRQLKRTQRIAFLADTLGVQHLPGWVVKPAQITDGHLLQLARLHGAKFATLDTGITGAELIGDEPTHGPMNIRDSAASHTSTCLILN